MKADNRTQSPAAQRHQSDAHDEGAAAFALPQPAAETTASVTAKDSSLRPVHNGFKPGQRPASLRPATRSAVKALPVGIHRNARRPSSQDRSRVQSVRAHATAQSVPPGVVDLIAAAQREIDAASASAEQLIRDNDFVEDGLDLDIDAFLESDSLAELVAGPGQDGLLPASGQQPDVHARRAHSPMLPAASHAAALRSHGITTTPPSSQTQPDTVSKAEEASTAATKLAAPISPTPAVRPSAATLPPKPTPPPSGPIAPTIAVPEAAGTAATAGVSTAAEAPPPGPAGPTAPAKDVAKNSTKQKRAHKNADAIRYITPYMSVSPVPC